MQCQYKHIMPETGVEIRCSKVISDKMDYCCVHDEHYYTGCRYNVRNWDNPRGHAETFCKRCGHVIAVVTT